MNDLQKLLALRGLSAREVARRSGINYHTVQKTLTGRRDSATHAKEAVAAAVGAPVEQLFGDDAAKALRGLIAQEINARAAAERKRLRSRYLRHSMPRIPHKRRAGNV
jgi:transcriptional regulator with XRE-family HTH domain